jgi:hypothetical protein
MGAAGATRPCDGGVEVQPPIGTTATAWYDVLEVMEAFWRIPWETWALIFFRLPVEDIRATCSRGLSAWRLIVGSIKMVAVLWFLSC